MTSKTVTVTIVQEGVMCAIPVPFDPRALFGKARVPVTVTLNGYTYRSTIAPMGGSYLIPLRKSNRDAAGVKGGDRVKVTIAIDTAAREVAVPEDLLATLRKKPQMLARWEALSYTQRREHAEALNGARKPETRARRLAKLLEELKS